MGKVSSCQRGGGGQDVKSNGVCCGGPDCCVCTPASCVPMEKCRMVETQERLGSGQGPLDGNSYGAIAKEGSHGTHWPQHGLMSEITDFRDKRPTPGQAHQSVQVRTWRCERQGSKKHTKKQQTNHSGAPRASSNLRTSRSIWTWRKDKK